MFLRSLCLTLILGSATLLHAADAQVKAIKAAPKGLPASIAASVNSNGYEVTGENGKVCNIWFAKKLPANPKFKPTLTVKYPFQQGQFIGVLQVVDGGGFTDFRAAEISGGLYTLRYAKQPEDGNHIGTSETADFFLALPIASDESTEPIADETDLNDKSAEAAGTGHPAILSLLPAEKAPKTPMLEHDEDHEFWILNAGIPVQKAGKADTVAMRLVVIGYSEE